MPNPTPAAQVAALTAEFGITPETHRHLFTYECPKCNEEIETIDGTPYCGCGDRSYDDPVTNIPHLPDPLGPDADGVWLAPIIHWCHKKQMWPQVQGIPRNMPEWEASILFNSINSHRDSTVSATAALLQACLAARVPEIVRAMEGVVNK